MGAQLAGVQVKVDRSRLGQLLEAEITDDINPAYQHAPKIYRLEIHLAMQDLALFINPDGTSARGDINWMSDYKLIKISDNSVIQSGSITRTSSYNTGEDASTGYASFVSVEDAKKRGIIELAQDYKLRVANLLEQLQTTGQAATSTPPQIQLGKPVALPSPLPATLQPAPVEPATP